MIACADKECGYKRSADTPETEPSATHAAGEAAVAPA